MPNPTTIRVTEASSRAEIEQAIVALRAKVQRMPSHWVDRREAVADEIDELVTMWIEAES